MTSDNQKNQAMQRNRLTLTPFNRSLKSRFFPSASSGERSDDTPTALLYESKTLRCGESINLLLRLNRLLGLLDFLLCPLRGLFTHVGG